MYNLQHSKDDPPAPSPLTTMPKQVPTRLACFALISAVEEDLRDFLRVMGGDRRILVDEVRVKAMARFGTSATTEGPEISDAHLLAYCDFADLAKSLRLLEYQGIDDQAVASIADLVEKASPARNRVCHSRPLEPDDLLNLLELAERLLSMKRVAHFTQTANTLERLKVEPTFVFGLSIPDYWHESSTKPLHNLPIPEFDDTGFLGRQKDRKDVLKHIVSAHPVITIVGEGGVGKTALALRCLYDIVDRADDQPFDAIVWVSLKTSALTPAGAVEMQDPISDVLGLYQATTAGLGVPLQANRTMEEFLGEILDYLASFRVLLAVDNLETIDAALIRPLLADVPMGSKVLLTSRVGIGEFELRYPLDRLSRPEAVALLRRYAQTLNLGDLAKQPEPLLVRYTDHLFGNPLLIKWFVSGVAAGGDPVRLVFGKDRAFEQAISYCFENLFERLDEIEKRVLHILASARRPLTRGQLLLIAEVESLQLDVALAMLHNSSMVRRTLVGEAHGYSLTDIALMYVTKLAPPPTSVLHMVIRRQRELREQAEANSVSRAQYRYDWASIHYDRSNPDEVISATYLRRAIAHIRDERFSEAERAIARAKEIGPGFAEVYRVEASLFVKRRQTYQADELFRRSIELRPDSARLRYLYALFLLEAGLDFETALAEVDRAISIDGPDPTLLTARALCSTRLGRYAEASRDYESVLASLDDRPRKWRVSTLDQVLECYRRWMESDRQMKDIPALLAHFSRAIEVLQRALEKGDWDQKTMFKSKKLFDEGARSALFFGQREIAAAIATELARHDDAYVLDLISDSDAVRQLPQKWRDSWLTAFHGRPGMEVFAADTTGDRAWTLGRIANLREGFGFIDVDSGGRLYFSRYTMLPQAAWERARAGLPVRFKLGKNSEGPCAVSVELVEG